MLVRSSGTRITCLQPTDIKTEANWSRGAARGVRPAKALARCFSGVSGTTQCTLRPKANCWPSTGTTSCAMGLVPMMAVGRCQTPILPRISRIPCRAVGSTNIKLNQIKNAGKQPAGIKQRYSRTKGEAADQQRGGGGTRTVPKQLTPAIVTHQIAGAREHQGDKHHQIDDVVWLTQGAIAKQGKRGGRGSQMQNRIGDRKAGQVRRHQAQQNCQAPPIGTAATHP